MVKRVLFQIINDNVRWITHSSYSVFSETWKNDRVNCWRLHLFRFISTVTLMGPLWTWLVQRKWSSVLLYKAVISSKQHLNVVRQYPLRRRWNRLNPLQREPVIIPRHSYACWPWQMNRCHELSPHRLSCRWRRPNAQILASKPSMQERHQVFSWNTPMMLYVIILTNDVLSSRHNLTPSLIKCS